MTVPPSAAEIKAVVKALEGEYPEDATSKDVALRVIQELDLQREKSDKFIVVMQINLPGGELHHFALGPYTAMGKATTAAQQVLPNAMKYKRDGEARVMVIPVVNNERDAWESIRPVEEDPNLWIKKSIECWGPSAWMDALKEKQGWGHKPSPVKEVINKEEEHS